jgi:hypothetical protein
MVDLLRAYETLCIQREDFSGAESVKNKIEQLQGQERVHKREKLAVLEKEQVRMAVCRSRSSARRVTRRSSASRRLGTSRFRP